MSDNNPWKTPKSNDQVIHLDSQTTPNTQAPWLKNNTNAPSLAPWAKKDQTSDTPNTNANQPPWAKQGGTSNAVTPPPWSKPTVST